jgi:hypothetical protein
MSFLTDGCINQRWCNPPSDLRNSRIYTAGCRTHQWHGKQWRRPDGIINARVMLLPPPPPLQQQQKVTLPVWLVVTLTAWRWQ